MHDNLGDRMKRQYEDRTRVLLPRRTYTIIRCDGKAFHTYTRRCQKPHDQRLADAMDAAAVALCEEAQGSSFGYVQSDEISVLLTDFATIHTDAWFDGNLQKMASVAASVVTERFNAVHDGSGAYFDARVFTIPDPVEVENYFIWRQNDAVRNSIQGLAQAHFSAKALHGKGLSEMHEMLHSVGINWNDLPVDQKRGRGVIYREQGWSVDHEIPTWTKERAWLVGRVPRIWAGAAATLRAIEQQAEFWATEANGLRSTAIVDRPLSSFDWPTLAMCAREIVRLLSPGVEAEPRRTQP